jgi:hypothetical protein
MSKRRRKAESSNGSDQTPIEVRKNTELTEDEQRVLLFQHKRQYEGALAVKKKADADLKNVCKLAKSECGKWAVADIKDLILLEQDKGAEAMKADIERKLRLARWAGAAVGTQFSFEEVDRRAGEDVARENGKIAGMKGEACNPPHDPSVPQHQAWIAGWHDGQAVLMSDWRDRVNARKAEPVETNDDLAGQTDLEEAIAGTPAADELCVPAD